jgi:pyocin large subunit-like protein
MDCILCGADSRRDRFCRKCKEKKRNATAIVSQNKKKLRSLLKEERYTPERIEKFILYSNNIVKYGKVIMEYKEKDINRRFEAIMKAGVITCRVIS